MPLLAVSPKAYMVDCWTLTGIHTHVIFVGVACVSTLNAAGSSYVRPYVRVGVQFVRTYAQWYSSFVVGTSVRCCDAPGLLSGWNAESPRTFHTRSETEALHLPAFASCF